MASTVQSVERAVALLELLAQHDEPLPLGQISTALSLPKGTVHGLLRTLVAVGFVDQLPGNGRYRVGIGLQTLAAPSWDHNEIKARSINWADALAARTRQSVRVAILRDGQALIAHHVFCADLARQSLQTGSAVPLHATSLGKVLLAFHPVGHRALQGQVLTRYTYRTIIDRVVLARELSQVRGQGWAASVGEKAPDRAGVSAPIRARSGHVVAAMGIFGDTDRICDSLGYPRSRLVEAVRDAARAVSRELSRDRMG